MTCGNILFPFVFNVQISQKTPIMKILAGCQFFSFNKPSENLDKGKLIYITYLPPQGLRLVENAALKGYSWMDRSERCPRCLFKVQGDLLDGWLSWMWFGYRLE